MNVRMVHTCDRTAFEVIAVTRPHTRVRAHARAHLVRVVEVSVRLAPVPQCFLVAAFGRSVGSASIGTRS